MLHQCYVPIVGRVIIPYEPSEELADSDFEDEKEDVTELSVLERAFKITRTTHSNTRHGNILKVIWLIEEKVSTNLLTYYVEVALLTKYFKLLHILPLNDEIMDAVCMHIGAHAQNTNQELGNLDFAFRNLNISKEKTTVKRRRCDSASGQRPTKK